MKQSVLEDDDRNWKTNYNSSGFALNKMQGPWPLWVAWNQRYTNTEI